ncbi:hypothetical protein Desti_3882 [Desulfomonile tiedjei DSM 6799]|uniref:Uncharacterized protein n=1 Tax=Desulfomonile tiedjei (strain ATCC 49306 / DSM 6799 / DCB-1) TaxID=706587 RepID=I4CAD3_DESTA|nr:hypothetical protein Desti_3882 [Desulfomonile tiedjei DSM 6799]
MFLCRESRPMQLGRGAPCGCPVEIGLRACHSGKGRHEICPYSGCARNARSYLSADEGNAFSSDLGQGHNPFAKSLPDYIFISAKRASRQLGF